MITGLINAHIISPKGFIRWSQYAALQIPANDDSDMADIAGAWR